MEKVRDQRGSRRFGEYLRHLREERRLTLDHVVEMALPHKQRISKAYLSRCENGIAEASLERLSVLSKIYRENVASLVVRREQERELDEIAPIDVTNESSEALREKGNEFVHRGELTAALKYFRTAAERAAEETGSSSSESVGRAKLSIAVALIRMSRPRLAREEAEAALRTLPPDSQDRFRAIMCIAIAEKNLGNAEVAWILLTSLGGDLQRIEVKPKVMADYFLLRGGLEFDRREFRNGIASFREAAVIYSQAEDVVGQVRSSRNAAIGYAKAGEPQKGIEIVASAIELARAAEDNQELARSLQTLGELQFRVKNLRAARAALRESIDLARKGEYVDTLFISYFYLWKTESDAMDPSAVSIRRILRSLLPRIDEALDEVEEFRLLIESDNHDNS